MTHYLSHLSCSCSNLSVCLCVCLAVADSLVSASPASTPGITAVTGWPGVEAPRNRETPDSWLMSASAASSQEPRHWWASAGAKVSGGSTQVLLCRKSCRAARYSCSSSSSLPAPAPRCVPCRGIDTLRRSSSRPCTGAAAGRGAGAGLGGDHHGARRAQPLAHQETRGEVRPESARVLVNQLAAN